MSIFQEHLILSLYSSTLMGTWKCPSSCKPCHPALPTLNRQLKLSRDWREALSLDADCAGVGPKLQQNYGKQKKGSG